MLNRKGVLLLIGTPLGNLSDLSPRALEALKSCDLLLCEDTRHTGKLLASVGVDVPTESFHDHNEDQKAPRMIERLKEGQRLGIASDAGMPLISDPGFALVRLARQEGIRVEPIPGPSAALAALTASGIPPTPSAFFGFPPHRHGPRLEFYREIATHRMTSIVYESPLRVVESLRDAREALGNVEVTVAREMTKIHEEFIQGSLDEVIAELAPRESIRGEVTIVFGAATVEKEAIDPLKLREEFERLRAQGMRRNDAIRLMAGRLGIRKNEIYDLLIGDGASVAE